MDVEFNRAIKNLPDGISKILKTCPLDVQQKASEIRLRAGRHIIINYKSNIYTLKKALSIEEIAECFKAICGYSIHSHTEEIKSGLLIFSGEIYDVEGNLRCGAKESISDESLFTDMKWIVRGVEVLAHPNSIQ